MERVSHASTSIRSPADADELALKAKRRLLVFLILFFYPGPQRLMRGLTPGCITEDLEKEAFVTLASTWRGAKKAVA